MMRQKFHQLLQSCRGLPQKFPQLAATWQKFRPELERFLIAGPTLIGYVLGLLRYPPGSVGFEIGFQSLVFFVGFIVLRITVELAAA
ncbi:MAG: hypothetical protein NZL89_01135, partial [Leptospiraceae bacterium]|nr:hypothetical protein [Leptospiraceae bacterium]